MTTSPQSPPAARLAFLQAILAFLPLLAACGCYPQLHAGPGDAPRPLVEVIELHEQPLAQTTTLIGVTEPWHEATLCFEVSGVVSDVFVEEGQMIEPAAPVAQLVLPDYQLALSQAQAELAAAQAKLNLLLAGTRKEDVAAAEADNARAQRLAEYWKGEWDRVARLNAISDSERALARAQHDAAVQEEQATRSRWEKAVAGFRTEEIAEARAQVDARQQAVALAQRNLDKTTLRAPFRGRVEQRLLDPGSYINLFPTGGLPVAKIVDLDQVDVLLDIPEALLAHCAEEAPLNIVSAVDPQVRGEARVISIGRVADRDSGTYALRARLDNSEHRFRGGMVVTAELATSSPRPAIRIPLSAVCHAYGQPPYVLLVDRKTSQVVAREVQLGPVAGDSIQVTTGLSPQDLLIVRGQDRVLPGDHVRHRPLGSPAAAETGKL